MIRGNESDVRNIDYELQAKRGDQFLCFTLFLNFTDREQRPSFDPCRSFYCQIGRKENCREQIQTLAANFANGRMKKGESQKYN